VFDKAEAAILKDKLQKELENKRLLTEFNNAQTAPKTVRNNPKINKNEVVLNKPKIEENTLENKQNTDDIKLKKSYIQSNPENLEVEDNITKEIINKTTVKATGKTIDDDANSSNTARITINGNNTGKSDDNLNRTKAKDETQATNKKRIKKP
jgi:hypothetical protein